MSPEKQHAILLLQQYDEWSKDRQKLSDQEEAGDFIDPDDWGASDDDGIHLYEEAMESLREFHKLPKSED